jgi:hypothetical protein
MKQYSFLIILFLAFLSCKKDTSQNTVTAEQITFAQEFQTCYNEKKFPQLPPKDTYIQGEIDGKSFSVSSTEDFAVLSTLTTFKARGYQKEYAELEKRKEWQGNSFAVVPISPSGGFPKSFQDFDIYFSFSSFRGDSLAYEQYFNQFQLGKTFKFAQQESDLQQLGVVDCTFIISGCANLSDPQVSRAVSSLGIDQAGSYCKVSDVKEYKSASGQIFRRDVTMLFEMAISTPGLQPKRIKNGKLFFTM